MAAVVPDEPRWLRDVAALWWTEVKLFASTAARFVTAPRRFGADWAVGRMRAMNPLGFLAASWPLLLPLDYGLQRWLGWDRRPNVDFTIEMARAMRPYLMIVPIALLTHAFLRLRGSRRSVTTTLGILLYWMAFVVFAWVVGLVVCFVVPVGGVLPKVATLATAPWGALALSGAHRRRFAFCLASLLVSSIACILAVNAVLDRFHLS
jgi:hypothetical protein